MRTLLSDKPWRVLAPLFTVGVLTLACGRSAPGTASQPSGGARAPLPIVPVSAAEIHERVAATSGSAVLVNVWATWCAPCREEFPDLLRLRRELGSQGLDLVLVSADFDVEADGVRGFLAEEGVEFETFLKQEQDMPFIEAMHPEWTGALPASFLYDGSGRLIRFWQGKATYEELRGEILPLLKLGSRPAPHSQGGTAS